MNLFLRMLSTNFDGVSAQCSPLTGIFANLRSPTDLRTAMGYFFTECAILNISGANVVALKIGMELALESANAQLNEENPPVGFSVDEIAVIKLYTMSMHPVQTSLYCLINEALRSPDRRFVLPFVPILWLLFNALLKAPPCPSEKVLRCEKRDTSEFYKTAELTQAPVTWPAFSVCSNSLEGLQTMTGNRTNYLIELTSGRSRDLSQLSNNREAADFLLLPNTRFQASLILKL